ncbi:MAG TPA: hypothetical protein VGB30_03370 [bacterium]
MKFASDGSLITPPPVVEPVSETFDDPRNLPPPVISVTADGKNIPRTYLDNFNPRSFSWPAFFFADLWHAEKGILKESYTHYTLRLLSTVLFCLFIVILLASKNDYLVTINKTQEGIAWFIYLIHFAIYWIEAALSYKDARVAHSRVFEIANSYSAKEIDAIQEKGKTVYLRMIFLPFFVFTFAFLIMLFSQLSW